jgi:hypothetical protein
MRLRIAKAFNDPDYIFELKHVAENEKARGRTGLSTTTGHCYQPMLRLCQEAL